MKVLWVSASTIGPGGEILDIINPGTSGGWIQEAYDLLDKESIEVVFACASKIIKSGKYIKKEKNEKVAYCFNLPRISFGRKPIKKDLILWEKMVQEEKPDIIHIWGTENVTQYLASLIAPEIPKVLFIQGILGASTRYFSTAFPSSKDNKYYSLWSKIKNIRLAIKQLQLNKQVKMEKEIYQNCKNIIIDNDFCKAYGESISNDLRYYNYSLPICKTKTDGVWNYDGCHKNTIFTVFANSKMKGMHQLLKALILLKRKYPDVKLLIPGSYSFGKGYAKMKRDLPPYEQWLARFLVRNNLIENVEFLGKLDNRGMKENYVNANLFVNPSCVENHAGSLREAMLIGLPAITSLSGSILEFVKHGENGFVYRYEEHEQLAFLIEKVFSNKAMAMEIGKNARESIPKKYSHASLSNIYNEILNREKD